MLNLKEGQVCPYSTRCPHNKSNSCWGGRSDRVTSFSCSYVKENGIFNESTNVQRNPLDKTGNMKVIME